MEVDRIDTCERTFHLFNTDVMNQNAVRRLLCIVDFIIPRFTSKTPNLSSHMRFICMGEVFNCILGNRLHELFNFRLWGFKVYKFVNSCAMDGTPYACGDDNGGKGLSTHLMEYVKW